MSEIKISELAETTDLEGLYTIGTDKNNLSKKVAMQFVKDAANYANEQGDYAKAAGDAVNGNVGVNDYPAFSSSATYSAGDVVRYNGILYEFTGYHNGAWSGSDVIRTSINAQAQNKLTELESEVDKFNSNIEIETYNEDVESIEILDGETLLHKIDKDGADFKNLKSNGLDVITGGVDDVPIAGSNNLVKSGGVYDEVSQLGQEITELESGIEHEKITDEIEEIDIYDGEVLKHQIKKDEANFSNLKSNGLDVITRDGTISESEISDTDETFELTDDLDNVLLKIDKEKVAINNEVTINNEVAANNYTYISGGSLNQTNKYLYKLNLDDLSEWTHDGWSISGVSINNNGHYGTSQSFGSWFYFNREFACDTRTFIIDFKIDDGGTAVFSTHWRTGGLSNPVYVDFPNGKMSIYIESTLIVETTFSFVSYANTPLRIIISRENRVITATLINLVDFSQIAQAQTDVWVTSEAHLFDNFGIASQNAQIDISNFIVNCKKSDSLLTQIYITGDSITEGDKILDNADRWTTMLQQDFPTDSVIVSGRSAGTIDSVIARLYSECQFLHPIYVMVTIGTNGGNTAENISNLIKHIYSYGAIPIINHVPCMYTGSHTAINEIIDMGILLSGRKVLSCKFDIATALDYDLSKGYDPTLFADGVHPNAAGCERMYKRVKIDCPELFN